MQYGSRYRFPILKKKSGMFRCLHPPACAAIPAREVRQAVCLMSGTGTKIRSK